MFTVHMRISTLIEEVNVAIAPHVNKKLLSPVVLVVGRVSSKCV